jgi:hypothetical protein
MIHLRTLQQASPDTRPKWFSSPISFYAGPLSDIGCHIPDFERRTFSLGQPGGELTRLNERLDTIVRKPTIDDPNFVPVGVVSKEYILMPHAEVLKIAITALETAQIPPTDVMAELKITEYGERMALSLYLPEEYSFDPGDGHPLALRLECFNSVDGSTRFRALMGWFRFVCSNGLIIGVTRSDVRRRHIGDIGLAEVEAVLVCGLEESEKEKKNFEQWQNCTVTYDRFASWINQDLHKGWGFKAAARTFHISRTGYDAEIIGPYKDNTPISIPMRKTTRVPGAPPGCRNLYDLSQILAWLAKERRDVQEQLHWREGIPELLKPLMN